MRKCRINYLLHLHLELRRVENRKTFPERLLSIPILYFEEAGFGKLVFRLYFRETNKN